MREAWINTVCHPASQRQAVIGNRLRRQQRVVDTPFLDPHYHHYRQLLLHDPFRQRAQVIHQAAPAARSFDDYVIDLLTQVRQPVG